MVLKVERFYEITGDGCISQTLERAVDISDRRQCFKMNFSSVWRCQILTFKIVIQNNDCKSIQIHLIIQY
jgi:hypothetical protein